MKSKTAAQLRELREMSGATLQGAAKIIGVSFTFLCNAERGFVKLTPKQIEKLLMAYGKKIVGRLQRAMKALEVHEY